MTDSYAPPVYFLLVDDREENLVALEAVLRRDGLELIKARSGAEALEALLRYDVALALIDVQMPTMNGFELAELMRGTERTRRIPIIFLTAASVDQQRRFRGYEAGAVDFLHKPIEADVLKSKAEVFFDLYRQRQDVARHRDELQAINEENSRLLEQTRRYAEALQLADQRKNEFLATLAHELRNPLAPILSAVQVVRLGELPQDELIELHDIIERQVHHMVRLIDDLLDVSRITRGKVELRYDEVDMADIVRNAVETSRPLIQTAGHNLSIHLPETPLKLRGDSVRLAQVVANLLNNAAKYTPEGGQIDVHVERQDDTVVVRVRDNGIGIPQEMRDDVFDMFTQVNQHVQHSRGGLGIGLTLVKRMVEMHQGQIEVHSEGEGLGSEFTVSLPLTMAEKTTVAATTQNPNTEATASHRVLVIDDNADAANGLAMLLRTEGHDVCVCLDGASGLEYAEQWKPHVVFLDLGMPEMDGYETARQITNLPEGKEVTLVAVTGWGQEEDRRRTQDAGFDYHLVKPADITALKNIFAQIVAPT